MIAVLQPTRSRTATCVALALALCSVGGESEAAAPRPHIIFNMIDDLGWSNVAWHTEQSESGPKQPHAMELLKESVVLDRHYAYVYCSPTRSSLLSGRLPYHVNQVNLGSSFPGSGIARNMTTIPRKLKQAGYTTHMIGKWHCGTATMGMTPWGRGFDTSLHYFDGAVDHWSSCNCVDGMCNSPNNGYSNGANHSAGQHCWQKVADLVHPPPQHSAPAGPHTTVTMGGQGTTDLWCTDKPCYGINNTDYNGFIFTRESVRIIEAHDPAVPLFMYIALQNNHEPLEVPAEYMDRYPADMYWDQRIMNAMSSFWDEAVGNITGALKRTGMWNNTLYVLSGDNGGPVYWTATPAYPHGGSANNYPLRAGKSSLFEGGVRVSAFASGGFLPVAMRGKTLGKTSQAIHMADWFHTFSSLAGVDWLDEPPNLPSNRDSIDVWPLISGATAISPRTEVPLAVEGTLSDLSGNTLEPGYPQHDSFNGSALIVGEFKLVLGLSVGSNFWQGEDFPNASYAAWMTSMGDTWYTQTSANCGSIDGPGGCLFNIETDPTEHHDLAASMPSKVQELKDRLKELRGTLFNPDRCYPYTMPDCGKADLHKAWAFWGGYQGPYMPPGVEAAWV